MLVHFVIAYISDSSSHEIHIQHIKRVLAYLLENQLDAKEDKREFNVTTVSFLDYVFIQEGITMDQAKVTVVTGWPTSSNCFVRFAILNTKLPSWNRDAEEAFHKLNTLFTTVPVLQHPDNAKPFVVEGMHLNQGGSSVIPVLWREAKITSCGLFLWEAMGALGSKTERMYIHSGQRWC